MDCEGVGPEEEDWEGVLDGWWLCGSDWRSKEGRMLACWYWIVGWEWAWPNLSGEEGGWCLNSGW